MLHVRGRRSAPGYKVPEFIRSACRMKSVAGRCRVFSIQLGLIGQSRAVRDSGVFAGGGRRAAGGGQVLNRAIADACCF
jgi:hypothetical protein